MSHKHPSMKQPYAADEPWCASLRAQTADLAPKTSPRLSVPYQFWTSRSASAAAYDERNVRADPAQSCRIGLSCRTIRADTASMFRMASAADRISAYFAPMSNIVMSCEASKRSKQQSCRSQHGKLLLNASTTLARTQPLVAPPVMNRLSTPSATK